jgi:hypothetical protein
VISANQSRVRLYKRDPKAPSLDREGHFLPASRDTTWEAPTTAEGGICFLNDPCLADAKEASEAIENLHTFEVSKMPPQSLPLQAVVKLVDDAEARNLDDRSLRDDVLK